MKTKKKSLVPPLHKIHYRYMITLGFFLILGAFSMGLTAPFVRMGDVIIAMVGGGNLTAQVGGTNQNQPQTLAYYELQERWLTGFADFIQRGTTDLKEKPFVTRLTTDDGQEGPVYTIKPETKFTIYFLNLYSQINCLEYNQGYIGYNGLSGIGEINCIFGFEDPKYHYNAVPLSSKKYTIGNYVGYAKKFDVYFSNYYVGQVDWNQKEFSFNLPKDFKPNVPGEITFFDNISFKPTTSFKSEWADEIVTQQIIQSPFYQFTLDTPFNTKVDDVKEKLTSKQRFVIKWKPLKEAKKVSVYLEEMDQKTGIRVAKTLVQRNNSDRDDGVIGHVGPLKDGVYRVLVEQYKDENDRTVLSRGRSNIFVVGTPQDKKISMMGDLVFIPDPLFQSLSVVKKDIVNIQQVISDLKNQVPFKVVSPRAGEKIKIDQNKPFVIEWTGSRFFGELYDIYLVDKNKCNNGSSNYFASPLGSNDWNKRSLKINYITKPNFSGEYLIRIYPSRPTHYVPQKQLYPVDCSKGFIAESEIFTIVP